MTVPSLLRLSRELSLYEPPIPLQKRNFLIVAHKSKLLSLLFEELLREKPVQALPRSAILCFREILVVLQKFKALLGDCSTRSQFRLLLQSEPVSAEFYELTSDLSTLLDILPDLGLSDDVNDLIVLLRRQCRNSSPEIDPAEEKLRKEILSLISDVEKEIVSDRSRLAVIFRNLGLEDYRSCQSEIESLETEIGDRVCEKWLPTMIASVGLVRIVHELRQLARFGADICAFIGDVGGVPLLMSLLSWSDPYLELNTVTTLLNLSIHEANKKRIMHADGAVDDIVCVMSSGATWWARENAAVAVLSLFVFYSYMRRLGRDRHLLAELVNLAITGPISTKKDAMDAIACLAAGRENIKRLVKSGRALISHHYVLVFEAFLPDASDPMPIGPNIAYLEALPDESRSNYRNVVAAIVRGDYVSCTLYPDKLKNPYGDDLEEGRSTKHSIVSFEEATLRSDMSVDPLLCHGDKFSKIINNPREAYHIGPHGTTSRLLSVMFAYSLNFLRSRLPPVRLSVA